MSAPAVFQRAMDIIVKGIESLICYIDDILVTNTTDEEHLDRLEEVLMRLKEYGLRAKKANAISSKLLLTIWVIRLMLLDCKPKLRRARERSVSTCLKVQYFHQYLYVRSFTLVTTILAKNNCNKPLTTILNSRKGIPPLAATQGHHPFCLQLQV